MEHEGLDAPRGGSGEELAQWAEANGVTFGEALVGIEELAFLLGDDEW